MRRHQIRPLIASLVLCSAAVQAQAPVTTDLDRFMVGALQRRDIDRQTLSDYVLDESETFEVLGPGRVPFARMRREYTFDNVWMDFLPAGWLVKVDELRASMAMGQPFPGVWLPKTVGMHAGVTVALGSMEIQYKRQFSNYRKADVSSKITVPKAPGASKGGNR